MTHTPENINSPDVIRAAILGFAAADAFGMPYETAGRGAFDVYADTFDEETGAYKMPKYAEGMPAYWYDGDLPAGSWTDDTAMTLATMASIGELKRVDPEDIMKRFADWNDNGAYSATGKSIGHGRKTLAALERFKNGVPALECGGAEASDNGDGSLMRMIPIAFCEGLMAESGVTVADLSSLTHAHSVSVRSCEIFVDFTRELLKTHSRDAAAAVLGGLEEPFGRLGGIAALPEDEIRSGGYVVEALESTLWCFLRADSYVDCVLKAISLGGDTDTIAAMAGGLAAMYFGAESIPDGWLAALQNVGMIENVVARFCEVFS